MMTIAGKRVLITGASSGIGAACARRFAREGAEVILWARRLDRLRELAAEIEKETGRSCHLQAVDVRDRDAVAAAAAALIENNSLPNVLINNAGLAAGFDFVHEGDHDDWDRMIDTNVKGLLNVTRALLPSMIRLGRGHIINIGSTAGHMTYPRGNVYAATKHAVRALTEGMLRALFREVLGRAELEALVLEQLPFDRIPEGALRILLGEKLFRFARELQADERWQRGHAQRMHQREHLHRLGWGMRCQHGWDRFHEQTRLRRDAVDLDLPAGRVGLVGAMVVGLLFLFLPPARQRHEHDPRGGRVVEAARPPRHCDHRLVRPNENLVTGGVADIQRGRRPPGCRLSRRVPR